jgi:hypothetical protein
LQPASTSLDQKDSFMASINPLIAQKHESCVSHGKHKKSTPAMQKELQQLEVCEMHNKTLLWAKQHQETKDKKIKGIVMLSRDHEYEND